MNQSAEEVFAAICIFAKELALAGYNPTDVKAGLKAWLINEDVELPVEKPKDRFYKKKDIRAAWKRQRSICPECGGILIDPNLNGSVEPSKRTVGDHFEPHGKGGETSLSNLRAIHADENSSKSNKDSLAHSKSTGRTIFQMIHDTNVGDGEG